MSKSKNLKFTVQILGILLSIFSTTAQAQLAPVGMEARIITFLKGDSEKNREIQNVRANNEAWLLQKEQQKYWNTTPGQMAIAQDSAQEKMAIKAMIRTLGNPVRDDLRDEWNDRREHSTVMEAAHQKGASVASALNGKSATQTKEEKIRFKWRIQPEKMRGRISASYKDFSTEANVQANGRRELASAHNLKELGVTARLAYRFDNSTTTTSLDKSLTEHINTRISHTVGVQVESKAEVIYSQSF